MSLIWQEKRWYFGQQNGFCTQRSCAHLECVFLPCIFLLHWQGCTGSFTSIMGYLYHAKKCGKAASELEKMAMKCHHCGKAYKSKAGLVYHLRSKHGPVSANCHSYQDSVVLPQPFRLETHIRFCLLLGWVIRDSKSLHFSVSPGVFSPWYFPSSSSCCCSVTRMKFLIVNHHGSNKLSQAWLPLCGRMMGAHTTCEMLFFALKRRSIGAEQALLCLLSMGVLQWVMWYPLKTSGYMKLSACALLLWPSWVDVGGLFLLVGYTSVLCLWQWTTAAAVFLWGIWQNIYIHSIYCNWNMN